MLPACGVVAFLWVAGAGDYGRPAVNAVMRRGTVMAEAVKLGLGRRE